VILVVDVLDQKVMLLYIFCLFSLFSPSKHGELDLLPSRKDLTIRD